MEANYAYMLESWVSADMLFIYDDSYELIYFPKTSYWRFNISATFY